MVVRRPFSTRTLAYARARASANMTGHVTITRMGEPTLDDTTLVVSSAERSQVYSGKARVHSVTGVGVATIGEIDYDSTSLRIGIPWDAPMPRQDDVVVVDATSDSRLTGRSFQVREVDAGGLLFAQITLSCTGLGESGAWQAVS